MTTTMMIQVRPARRDSSYIIIITIIITKHIVHFLVSWSYTTLPTLPTFSDYSPPSLSNSPSTLCVLTSITPTDRIYLSYLDQSP